MAEKKRATRKQARPKASRLSAAGGVAAGGKTGSKTGSKAAGSAAAGDEGRVAEIQRLIDVMVAAGAVEVEMQSGPTRLRVRLREEQPAMVGYAPAPLPAPLGPAVLAPQATAAAAGAAPGRGEETGRVVFSSPMVGTFYRASSPDAEPFVDVGDRITAESTICILEAMKVMNEIKAELEGEIVEILCQNGEPVEFGQPLFVIKVA
jgi:acetyl-CoA carboxylase biotin carboxyl carrier protein